MASAASARNPVAVLHPLVVAKAVASIAKS